MEVDARNELSLLKIGDAYRRNRQFEKGIELYRAALRNDADNARWLNNLGVFYRMQSKPADAETS